MPPLAKVCGVTTPAAATHAASAGADLIGIVLVPGTPRHVPAEQAAPIARAARAAGARAVGVAAGQPADRLRQLVDLCQLDILQLHGDETPELVQNLSDEGLHLWKALRVGPDFDRDAPAVYSAAGARAILLDAWHPSLRGGTGRTTDPGVASAVAAAHRVVLAGGLCADNVAEAIAVVHPWAVDASSALESSPGVKDPDLVGAYLAAVRRCP